MTILRLKDILEEKGMSSKELAERVDVSAQTISNIIRGVNFPKPELLLNISKELDVDIRDLFIPTKTSNLEPIYVKRNNGFIEIGNINLEE